MNTKNVLQSFILICLLSGCGEADTTNKSLKLIDSSVAVGKTASDTVRCITILDTEALRVLDSSAAIEIIASGFKWSEGPVFITDGEYLLFSDVPANKVYKWKEGQGTTLFLEPSGYTGTPPKEKEPGSNGLIIGKDGKLVLCQHGNRQLAKMKSSLADPTPVFETIVSAYQGKKFNSPNDAVYAKNGNLYITDPPYGLDHGLKDSTKELSFQGVFCLRPNGKLELITDQVSYPNGIALSPDNKILYVSNSDNDHKEWTKYELDKNGLPVKSGLFYRVTTEEGKIPGSPDGMKVNQDGYIFASGPGGIWLFNPNGKVIARIHTGELTSNCALDPSHHILYMTCHSKVMRMKMK